MSPDDESKGPAKVNPAELETRMVPDDEVDPSRGTHRVDPAADETLLAADDDDHTELVGDQTVMSPPGEEMDPDASKEHAATRVLDPSQAADSATRDATPSGTRVVADPEDKTAPPPVDTAPDPVANASADRSPGDNSAADNALLGMVPGKILFGEYEIVNVLGVGGMGEVFRARHRRLDEFRAIKVMHADLASKKGASEFFFREAKALLAVRHPAVVHCHDLLSDDSGRVYLVMEMIEGISLSEKMNEGPLSPDDVAVLGARVSHGLSAAHRKGVIHRDVSPDNIVLPNGRVKEAKLIDFGIAKILEEGEGTILDGFKGKLSYASPEQLGFFGGKIDGRSDFYSLGLVLVAAALGRPMSMGTTVMEAVDARRGFDVLPDEIPMGLRSAIAPLLALDPKDRPKFVDRLFVVPGGALDTDSGVYEGRRSSPSSTSSKSKPAIGDSKTMFAAGGLALVLALGGGAYWMMASEEGAAIAPDSGATIEASVVAEGADQEASPADIENVPSPVVKPAPEPVVVANVAPKPRRLTASDRIKIIGLLNNAKLALSENRLMSPAGDNAYDRYRRVLSLDSKNKKAKAGLRTMASRYISLAESSASKGNEAQARDFIERARKADPTHPELEAVEARIAR